MFTLGKKTPTDTPTTTPTRGGSLMPTLMPAIAGSAAVALVCAALIHFVMLMPGGDDITRQLVAAEALQVQRQAQANISNLDMAATAIAKDPRLATTLSSGDSTQIQASEALIARMLPEATRITLLPVGSARRDPQGTPPISFAQVEMIHTAEAGKPVAPEIHKVGNSVYLSLVKRIPGADGVVGTLFIAFDFTRAKSLLGSLPPHIAHLEWQQVFAGTNPLQVAQLDAGVPGAAPVKISWDDSHWQILASPREDSNPLGGMAGMIAALLACAAVVLAGLGMLSLWLASRKVETNLSELEAHLRSMFRREKSQAEFTLSAVALLTEPVEKQFLSHDAALRQQIITLKNTPGKAAHTPVAASAAPILQVDPLDIQLDASDADLFMGGSSATMSDDFLDGLGDALDMDMVETPAARPAPAPAPAPARPAIRGGNTSLPDEIFRAYDIRGIVDKTLTVEGARLIGLAVGSHAMEQAQDGIVVARDGRLSSEALHKALIEGLVESGQRVIDIGMVPTPVMYFATHHLGTHSGVMVTGSHNPPDYNGFKIVIEGEALHGDAIQGLHKRIQSADFTRAQGSYETADVLKAYKDRITHDVVLARPMRVVVDCGNGVGGVIFPELMDKLGCNVTTLFGDVDGRFPNHHPDPSEPRNLMALIKAVQEKRADIGLAIDGDGDRLGVVTPSGNIIWPDRLLMLFARDLLSRNPGADVVYDVKCTRDIVDLVSQLGGRAILSATGHSVMKAKMKDTGAVVGGELSGHIYFNDRWYGFDDACYAAARLLEILSMEATDADEVFNGFPVRVGTPEVKIPVSEARKFAIMDKLAANGNFSGGNMVKVDGIRVDYPDGWGLIRASNTTPNLVARFEADNEQALDDIIARFESQLQRAEPGLTIPV